jgi:hypothetical protein
MPALPFLDNSDDHAPAFFYDWVPGAAVSPLLLFQKRKTSP